MKEWREAYIAGVKKYVCVGRRRSSHVASVASFFISRIDSMVDGIVKARLTRLPPIRRSRRCCAACWAKSRSPTGSSPINVTRRSSPVPYGPQLAEKGAQTQRVLWASTSTKDPSYSDVLYIEELIGPDTVNTIPPATFDAFRDHGKPEASLESDLDAAQDTMDTLEKVGISMKKVTDDLVTQAVKLFAEPFDKLLNSVDAKCKLVATEVDPHTYSLPAESEAQVHAAVEDWKMAGKVRRLWARDASLWTGTDEGSWLGWLGITEDQLAHKRASRRSRRRYQGGWFQARLAARHGRIQPLPGSAQDDFRQGRRIPGAVRARFHRSRAGQGVRE